ncbi:MAG: hypothetical protein JRI67_11115 [Deltaproteobacteria bacterium]|nr:hypothetical protein [Deltaproteobacteria bacterium]MBW2081424.1 hypothetical protein [Deltaproteobacteria bacterium]
MTKTDLEVLRRYYEAAKELQQGIEGISRLDRAMADCIDDETTVVEVRVYNKDYSRDKRIVKLLGRAVQEALHQGLWEALSIIKREFEALPAVPTKGD